MNYNTTKQRRLGKNSSLVDFYVTNSNIVTSLALIKIYCDYLRLSIIRTCILVNSLIYKTNGENGILVVYLIASTALFLLLTW